MKIDFKMGIRCFFRFRVIIIFCIFYVHYLCVFGCDLFIDNNIVFRYIMILLCKTYTSKKTLYTIVMVSFVSCDQ